MEGRDRAEAEAGGVRAEMNTGETRVEAESGGARAEMEGEVRVELLS